jgi:cytidylate kinase
MQIAVDGPAGSGKSTISKMIANQLKFEYIDTGAMYRAITLKSMNQDIRPEEYDKLEQMLHDTDIDFKDGHIYLDGIAVDEAIRENKINQNVSNYAVIKFIRLWMVDIQRKIASNKDVIMDGRDIGSYVLP